MLRVRARLGDHFGRLDVRLARQQQDIVEIQRLFDRGVSFHIEPLNIAVSTGCGRMPTKLRILAPKPKAHNIHFC